MATTPIDVELNAAQVDLLDAIARHEGRELREIIENAVTSYAVWLRGLSPVELDAYIDGMRQHPESLKIESDDVGDV